MRRELLYVPFALPLFLLLLLLLLPLFFAILFLNLGFVIGEILGFPPLLTLFLFLAILAGSTINIPVAEYKCKVAPTMRRVRIFGVEYIIPEWRHKTVVAVNLGGAVIPTLIALYLATRVPLLPLLLTTGFVILVSKASARTVPGVGIAMPLFLAPIATILAAALSLDYFGYGPRFLAQLAFSAAVFGVLIGADLLNLRRVIRMCVPMISIGGAGTFDGIFLTGIFATLFAAYLA